MPQVCTLIFGSGLPPWALVGRETHDPLINDQRDPGVPHCAKPPSRSGSGQAPGRNRANAASAPSTESVDPAKENLMKRWPST